ncbi:Hypothetical predicted protein [Paramuricea clavata]|uniref:Uncharacterized protein n=1 Tax=Paramuricea clavata TaxID=317549 RepID=A0A6S7G5M9_PARCT|nr:Hypothetical predicted protein [Paramuricea clavata]
MIYLDFLKAFDSVSHPKLLLKLQQQGISALLLNWFSDYLSNRRQQVVVNAVASSYLHATSGVPQGSLLGPLLFLIYANDLTEAANHSIVPMFADDSKCYKKIEKPQLAIDTGIPLAPEKIEGPTTCLTFSGWSVFYVESNGYKGLGPSSACLSL